MKKKIMLTATAVALATMMIVGGTIAWFTDEAEVTNVITMGDVEISLRETDDSEAGFTDVGLQFGGEVPITPGAELAKDPYVVNTGLNDAWVRVLIELSGTAPNVTGFDFEDLIAYDNINWTLGTDGYYYYNTLLAVGDSTSNLFEEVTIPTAWGNEFENTNLTIKITAYAVQADNLAATTAQAAFAETAPVETTTAE